jgi:hypothetical protein
MLTIGSDVIYVRESLESIRSPDARAMYDWFQR